MKRNHCLFCWQAQGGPVYICRDQRKRVFYDMGLLTNTPPTHTHTHLNIMMCATTSLWFLNSSMLYEMTHWSGFMLMLPGSVWTNIGSVEVSLCCSAVVECLCEKGCWLPSCLTKFWSTYRKTIQDKQQEQLLNVSYCQLCGEHKSATGHWPITNVSCSAELFFLKTVAVLMTP